MNTDLPRTLWHEELVHLLPADHRGKPDAQAGERGARCSDLQKTHVYVLTASGDQFTYRNGQATSPGTHGWPFTPDWVARLYTLARQYIIQGRQRGSTYRIGTVRHSRDRWGAGWLAYPVVPAQVDCTRPEDLQQAVDAVLSRCTFFSAALHAELCAALTWPRSSPTRPAS